MEVETAADLLTWKNAQLEQDMVLEFAQHYEKLNDEQKRDLIEIANSARRDYLQEMIKRVRELGKPRIQIELSHADEIQDASNLSANLNAHNIWYQKIMF